MTIFDIARTLPNGFHDSEVESIRIDYRKRTVEIELHVWVGTMDDPPSRRETYRMGRLSITGLDYCAIDVPDERSPYNYPDALTIDLADPAAFVPGTGSFGCRLWVGEWYGFIHLAAQAAEFSWTAAAVNRSGA